MIPKKAGSMEPHFQEVVRPDGVVLAIAGELDISNIAHVKAALDRALAAAGPTVCLDLREVEYADSTFMREIARAHSSAAAAGKTLTLVVAPLGSVHRILEVTGLLSMLGDHESVEAAFAAQPSSD
jgi:anti-anti-sigma factor